MIDVFIYILSDLFPMILVLSIVLPIFSLFVTKKIFFEYINYICILFIPIYIIFFIIIYKENFEIEFFYNFILLVPITFYFILNKIFHFSKYIEKNLFNLIILYLVSLIALFIVKNNIILQILLGVLVSLSIFILKSTSINIKEVFLSNNAKYNTFIIYLYSFLFFFNFITFYNLFYFNILNNFFLDIFYKNISCADISIYPLLKENIDIFRYYLSETFTFLIKILFFVILPLYLLFKDKLGLFAINFAFILSNILLEQFNPDYGYNKTSSLKANMHTIQTSLETYAVDWGGFYPKNIKELRNEANKKGYWKELKNPTDNNLISITDYSKYTSTQDKDPCKKLKNRVPVGVVLYAPQIINGQVIKYYLYGTTKINPDLPNEYSEYLFNIELLKDKGQIFYLTNS